MQEYILSFSSVRSVTQSYTTLCNHVSWSTPGFHVHHQLSEFAQTHGDRQWCHSTISFSVISFSSRLQSFPASGPFQMSQLFVSRWPKYWGFNFSISLFNEYSGLTSFRMDWLNLLAVQGMLKTFLQHHSSKASILRRLAFFSCEIVISDFISLNFLTSFM